MPMHPPLAPSRGPDGFELPVIGRLLPRVLRDGRVPPACSCCGKSSGVLRNASESDSGSSHYVLAAHLIVCPSGT